MQSKDEIWALLNQSLQEKHHSTKSDECEQPFDSSPSQNLSALGREFVQWIFDENQALKQEDLHRLWRDFLKEKGFLSEKSIQEIILQTFGSPDLPLFVFMQGIPGIGKSSVALRAVELFRSQGIDAVQVAQDDFFRFGKKKSGEACFNHVRDLLRSRKHKVVILARNNATHREYARYLALDHDRLCRSIFVAPEEIKHGYQKLLYLCVASVLYRQAIDKQGDHPTTSMDSLELASLPLRFISQFRAHPAAFYVSFMSQHTFDIPDEPRLRKSIEYFRRMGFKGKISDQDLIAWKLNDSQHLKSVVETMHRPLDEVAGDVVRIIQNNLSVDIPPLGSFIAVTLDATKIVEACEPIPSHWKRRSELHLTLIHSNDFHKNPKQWHFFVYHHGKLIRLSNLKLIRTEKLIVVTASVSLDDRNIDTLIPSGIPHITIATAPHVDFHETMECIKKVQGNVLPFSELQGIIKFVDSKEF